jgi:hypothetical protein
MNIFILNEDPVLAANDHCDKHVVKMILESAQMLSTAHWIGWKNILSKEFEIENMKSKQLKAWLREKVPNDLQPVYAMTHVNHPCTIWARETKENYLWLCRHAKALCEEYTRRYSRRHKSENIIDWLSESLPPHLVQCELGLTTFAQAMPDIYKHERAIEAYRAYYINEKSHIAKWRYSYTPDWFLKSL